MVATPSFSETEDAPKQRVKRVSPVEKQVIHQEECDNSHDNVEDK